MKSRHYGERQYFCRLNSRGSKPVAYSLVEAAAVRDLDGQLVWFESGLAFYPKEEEIYQALCGLVDYLNQADPLRDRLDRRKRGDGGISLCHKRRVISPAFLNNPRQDSAIIQDEAISHVIIPAPPPPAQVRDADDKLTRDVDMANQQREAAAQLAYYHSLLATAEDEEAIADIEVAIQCLLDSDKPITKRSSIGDRSERTEKALRSIRII